MVFCVGAGLLPAIKFHCCTLKEQGASELKVTLKLISL